MHLIRKYSLYTGRCIAMAFFFCSLSLQAQNSTVVRDSFPSLSGKPALLYRNGIPSITQSANSNSCNTSTFRLRLTAGQGQKIDIKDVYTLANGNFLLAGNSFLPLSSSKGLICILNNAGAVQLQQEIEINNSNTSIFAAKATYAGNIFIAGAADEGGGKLFVTALSPGLIPVWTTLLDAGQMPSNVAMSLMENGKVVVAAQFATVVKYAILSPTGSILWQRQAAPAGMDTMAGIGSNDFGQISMIVNCTRSGKKVVDIITTDENSGVVLSSHTAGSINDEYQYGKVTSFANRFISTGVVKDNTGQHKLIRHIMFDSDPLQTAHTYELPLPASFAFSSATDVAGDAPAFCFPQQGKLVFIRHYADYQTSPEYTRTYDVATGSSLAGVCRSLIDGGYLFGLNTASRDSIILIKTDSIGVLAGCSYNTVSNNYTEVLNISNTSSGTVSTLATDNVSLGNVSQANAVVTVFTDCNQNYCPPPPPDDTCLSTYYKSYRTNSLADVFSNYNLMRNNNHIVLTSRYERISGTNNSVTYGLKLFNERGDFVKGVNVFTNGVSAGVSIQKVDDQHIMMMHYTNAAPNPDYTFTLIDDSLRIVWSKSVKRFAGFPAGVVIYGNLTKDEEGNYYYVSVSPGFQQPGRMAVYKMDANGDEVWLKTYSLPNSSLLYANIITTSQTVITVIEGGQQGSVSVSLDKTTGQLLNAYQYPNNAGGSVYKRQLGRHNGYIFYAGNSYINFSSYLVLMLFDSTGFPVKMKRTNTSSGPISGDTRDGKFYLNFSYNSGAGSGLAILRTDTTLVPDFITQYSNPNDDRSTGMGVSANGPIYIGGNYFYGGVNGNYVGTYIRKADSSGITGTCSSQPVPNLFTDVPFTVTSLAGTIIPGNFTPVTVPVLFVPDTAGPRVSDLLCSSTPFCTSIAITGPQAVCQINQPFTYLTNRNQGCNLRPQWTFDTSFAVLQAITDIDAVFSFKRVGITKLYAKINTGCQLYTDSIEVNIQNSPTVFSLGADTLLCPGDSIILNAGAGFNTYLWQDGSTDSIFVVHGPGQYYVGTSNLCGSVYTDTITVTAVIIPQLNIGPDAEVCVNDTLHLQAQPGFATYNWFPTPGITGNGQQAFVIPTGDMQAWVRAVTAEGCIKSDTLSIVTISAPPVFIGRDTSFCINDSVVLSAGTGYQHYLWNTGAVGSSITVNQAGTYSINATAANGCSTKDTMQVLQTYALPQPSLGNDFTLCDGNQRRLDPGMFTSYLWQNGSTAGFLNVSSPGTYYVKVTNANQCSASDTVVLVQLLPSPAGFLNPTDSICEFSTTVLTPSQNFSTYQWSTGATQKAITVTAPGNYILSVINNDGCIGNDTISVVQKNCFTGVFIPTAFTPNNDGLNDLFKPIILGTVVSFLFEVYDRYGQLVFSTSTLTSGWNGTVQGIPQSSGLYIWQCRYQLAGKPVGYQKGTVTLIR